jgi:hypothetical protein
MANVVERTLGGVTGGFTLGVRAGVASEGLGDPPL